MPKKIVPIAVNLALMLLFVLHAGGVYSSRLIEQMDLWLYDLRLRVTMPGGQDSRIVIVDIDEHSLAEVGRWPWGRDVVARMVDLLFERYKVAIAGFDVVFVEPDHSSGLSVLEEFARRELEGNREYLQALGQLRGSLDYDGLLAASLAKAPVVLGYFCSATAGGKGHLAGQLPPPSLTKSELAAPGTSFVTYNGYSANLPGLQEKAAAAGHLETTIDFDGIARRVPLLVEYGGAYYESFAVAVVRALFGFPELKPFVPAGQAGYGRMESLAVGDMKIPVDEKARALIPYRGRQGSFPYVSAAELLAGRVDPALLEGAIVLVGTSAAGLMDLRSTPVSEVYAGVEVHANMIAGLLDQNIRSAPPYTMAVQLATLLLVGLLLAFLLPKLNSILSMVVTAGMLAAVVAGNMHLWQKGLVLPLASPLLMIPLLYLFQASYGFLMESRSRRQITGLFGQYVPPEIVEEMSRNPESFTMEADSREMTVLFSDVRNFTTISEGLDPKQLAQLMNEYMTPMTAIIYESRGTVDKYIGDAIMAFWGAPLRDPDHAQHAIMAALKMQEELARLRPLFLAKGWPEIRIGVGLNSGEVSVGNMGSRYRMAYTALGDTVNLASRLEGITKEYGVGIVVGEKTRAAISGVCFRELDLVRVKGKNKPVAIFEPLGREEAITPGQRDELERYHQVVGAYRRQEWERAESLLTGLIAAAPECRLYALYQERVAYFRSNPPPAGWDGVFVFKTK